MRSHALAASSTASPKGSYMAGETKIAARAHLRTQRLSLSAARAPVHDAAQCLRTFGPFQRPGETHRPARQCAAAASTVRDILALVPPTPGGKNERLLCAGVSGMTRLHLRTISE